MVLKYVLETLADGKAFKRPAWRGYGFKTVTDATADLYTITFKNASGTTYVYTKTANGWTAPATMLPIDASLFESLLFADDWIFGEVADFETARSGSGGIW